VAGADSQTREIEVEDAAALLRMPAAPILIDVREPDEFVSGVLERSHLVPRAELPSRIRTLAPELSAIIVVYCASGARSALAAQTLLALGYSNAHSMRGGIKRWRECGLPVVAPSPYDQLAGGAATALSSAQLERYARHLRLAEVGVTGQTKLLDARVLCIGAGGLGSPASLYLAAAGIGHLGIVDHDRVDLSNLQRQVVHTTARVGAPKTESASATLAALNPDVDVIRHDSKLTAANALDVLANYDVILDGSDNFPTRYLVNDAALRLGKPVVYGAVQRFEGQVSVFAGAPCYRCLFPQPPPADAAPSCQEAGVLGVLPGVIGMLQATEAIKLILGIGESLLGRLVLYDALTLRFSELKLAADRTCRTCAPGVDRGRIELRDQDGCVA
jgi:sulfur-carrier protein adenylyltransferase/sulfurtransferase